MEEEVKRLRATLAQVHNDSREIEAELEAELAAREQACEDVKNRLHEALAEASKWKTECADARSHGDRVAIELETAQSELLSMRRRIHILEIENDNLETSNRTAEGTLQTLETENHELVEALALKEVDAAHTEQLAEELQHTRQELTEAHEEIDRLRREHDQDRAERTESGQVCSALQAGPVVPTDLAAPVEDTASIDLAARAGPAEQVGSATQAPQCTGAELNDGPTDEAVRAAQHQAQHQAQHHAQRDAPARPSNQGVPHGMPQYGMPQFGLPPTKLRSSEWVLMDVYPSKVNAAALRPLQSGKLSHGHGHGLTK